MKYHIPFFLVIILFTSCKQELNDFPDTGRKIVINGLITTDSLFSVRIGSSSYILDISGTSYELQGDLKNAVVKVYQNQTYIDSLSHSNNGFFDYIDVWHVFTPGNYGSKNIFPQIGSEYQISVNVPGFPEAKASVIIPEKVEIGHIDSIGIVLPTGEFVSDNKGTMYKIQFTDPINTVNYYLLSICKVPSVIPFNGNLDFTSTDPIIEEKLNSGRSNEGIAFSDKLINGQKHTLSIILKDESIAAVQSEDEFSIYFRLYSITEEYFRYIQTLNLYSKNFGNPLAEPVMMFSNVTGGFGMFTGAAVSSYSIKLFKK